MDKAAPIVDIGGKCLPLHSLAGSERQDVPHPDDPTIDGALQCQGASFNE